MTSLNSDHAAFVAAVVANRKDHTSRLVLADYLEEKAGKPDHAELIRRQLGCLQDLGDDASASRIESLLMMSVGWLPQSIQDTFRKYGPIVTVGCKVPKGSRPLAMYSQGNPDPNGNQRSLHAEWAGGFLHTCRCTLALWKEFCAATPPEAWPHKQHPIHEVVLQCYPQKGEQRITDLDAICEHLVGIPNVTLLNLPCTPRELQPALKRANVTGNISFRSAL